MRQSFALSRLACDRRFIRLLVATLLLLAGASAALGAPSRALNVLLVVIDDLRPELRTYGVEAVSTPHLDAFSQRGLQFNRAYCQYPVCNASRSSFLTGKRPDELGVYSNEEPFRRVHPEIVTLPQAFRNAGYYTAGLGKLFHQGLDAGGEPTLFRDAPSFEHSYRALGRSPSIGLQGEGRLMGDGSIPWCQWVAAEGGDAAQPDGMLAAEAIRVLEEVHERPFFLSVGFHKPHDPFIAPREYFQAYADTDVTLPVRPDESTPLNRHALPGKDAFASFNDRDRREFKRAYQACVSFVDAQVGKLFNCLDRLELWDNTIVVVMGDHGYHLGEHGWWNKVTVFEHGARTPFVVWLPGAAAMGNDSDAIVELLDLYPTLTDCCGLEPPHRLSGKSLRPILEGRAEGAAPYVAYTQVVRGGVGMGYSVRTDRFRFTQWGRNGEGGVELYEHPVDHDEYFNLAARPSSAAHVAELSELLQAGFPALRLSGRAGQ